MTINKKECPNCCADAYYVFRIENGQFRCYYCNDEKKRRIKNDKYK